MSDMKGSWIYLSVNISGLNQNSPHKPLFYDRAFITKL